MPQNSENSENSENIKSCPTCQCKDICGCYECAHEDSLTRIINEVVEKHALKASDLRSLLPGETIRIVIFDRNIGDYLHGEKAGTLLNTREYLKKCHTATFTRSNDANSDGLRGDLHLEDVGETFHDWTIEINVAKWSPKWYWGDIEDSGSLGPKTPEEVPGETKVGWRGPAILFDDIDKMPETFRHYDTCCDDYFIIKNRDLSGFATVNTLTDRHTTKTQPKLDKNQRQPLLVLTPEPK